MVKRLKEKNRISRLKKEDYYTLQRFTKTFDTTQKPKDFFMPFYKTRLMKPERMPIKENGQERIANYVSIFGFLRTIFLGVITGDPRLGYLSKRVQKYKKTMEITDLLESFIRMYRNVIGFHRRTPPKHILASANVFSQCEKKPKNLCFPPKCEYIHHTRRARGYCRTKRTRKNKRTRSRKNRT
jgi:hypothetical protein